MADLRFTPADQVLINAAGVLVAQRVYHQADIDLALDVAAEVMGKGNPDNPLMGPLINPMQRLIDARPIRGWRPHQGHLLTLAAAVEAIMKWRMGLALEDHRKRHKGEAA